MLKLLDVQDDAGDKREDIHENNQKFGLLWALLQVPVPVSVAVLPGMWCKVANPSVRVLTTSD